MIELAMTICALTFMAPYYDCSEQWDINVYDTKLIDCGSSKEVLGCASYDRLFGNDKVDLVQNHYETMGKHTPKLKHESILWHELLHLTCQCDWHEYWDKKDDVRSHRYNQQPEIPETVIPFLKDRWIR